MVIQHNLSAMNAAWVSKATSQSCATQKEICAAMNQRRHTKERKGYENESGKKA